MLIAFVLASPLSFVRKAELGLKLVEMMELVSAVLSEDTMVCVRL